MFQPLWRRNSAHECKVLPCPCTEHFIITLPSSRYDLDNVKRDVKHQSIITTKHLVKQTHTQKKGQKVIETYHIGLE